MPVQKLKSFLDKNHVKYVVISHSAAYTAQEVAAYAHVPGRELAKTVMLVIDENLAMAVVPASHRVDLRGLQQVAHAAKIELATETEFKGYFPQCDVGAMPPFGNLYGMDVYVADALAEDTEIAFSAGSHAEVIRLAYADFERLVEPKRGDFSRRVP